MIAISIGNGSGDAQGSERGLEYDTMSGLYAEFVEKEVLPLVGEEMQREALPRIPTGGPRQGCSSGGAAAMAMAWYHTNLYHRVLTYSERSCTSSGRTTLRLRTARGSSTKPSFPTA